MLANTSLDDYNVIRSWQPQRSKEMTGRNCQRACERTDGCAAMTWNKLSKWCELKLTARIGNARPNEGGAISGFIKNGDSDNRMPSCGAQWRVREMTLYPYNHLYQHNVLDVKHLVRGDPAECCDACRRHGACRAWNLEPKIRSSSVAVQAAGCLQQGT